MRRENQNSRQFSRSLNTHFKQESLDNIIDGKTKDKFINNIVRSLQQESCLGIKGWTYLRYEDLNKIVSLIRKNELTNFQALCQRYHFLLILYQHYLTGVYRLDFCMETILTFNEVIRYLYNELNPAKSNDVAT